MAKKRKSRRKTALKRLVRRASSAKLARVEAAVEAGYVLPPSPFATNDRVVLDSPVHPKSSLALIRRAVGKVSGPSD